MQRDYLKKDTIQIRRMTKRLLEERHNTNKANEETLAIVDL